MIIIEGADLAGKSTLTDYLAARFKATKQHLGLPPAGLRHWDVCKAAMISNPPSTVYDRMCIGSFVYGQLLHDEPNRHPVTQEEMYWWTQAVHRLGGMLIWARATHHDIIERYQRDGDAYLDLDTILKAHDLYENAIRRVMRYAPRSFKFAIYNSSQENPRLFTQRNMAHIESALVGESETQVTIERLLTGRSA